MTSVSHGTGRTHGEVITFYSYKGGTGRSMALANVACLLARWPPDGERPTDGKKRSVLMVDWDLEAPGLHRYFQGRLTPEGWGKKTPPDEKLLDGRPGLIDLFRDLESATPPDGYETEDEGAEDAARLVRKFWPAGGGAGGGGLPLKVADDKLPNLHLLKAGRFDEEYSQRVNTFDWEGLHGRSPWLIRSLAARWTEQYDYVLVDSRTGITDTSGICTVLLPEKLVVVFTPNRQSFTGIENLVKKAIQYRKESDDVRPLIVFPLPSRIEASLGELRKLWRSGDGERLVGFQPLFEKLFREAYALPPGHGGLEKYFEEVQVQQTPDYAYGEKIAVITEGSADRFSMTRTYKTFKDWLVKSEGPWERPPREVQEQTETEEDDAVRASVLAKANEFFSTLPREEQGRALRLLARLTTVAPPGERSRDSLGRAKFGEIEQAAHPAAGGLMRAGMIVATRDAHGEESTFEITDERLVRDWPPLRDWVEKNRAFLLWRQKLKTYLDDWEQGGRLEGQLLSGSTLDVAGSYLRQWPEDLNHAEASYIEASVRHLRNQRRGRLLGTVVAVLIVLALMLMMWQFRRAGGGNNNGTNVNANAPVFGGGNDYGGGGSGGSAANRNANTANTGNMNTSTTGPANRNANAGGNSRPRNSNRP